MLSKQYQILILWNAKNGSEQNRFQLEFITIADAINVKVFKTT